MGEKTELIIGEKGTVINKNDVLDNIYANKLNNFRVSKVVGVPLDIDENIHVIRHTPDELRIA